MTDFSEWLEEELKRRNWKQADLCREGNIPSGSLSTALTRNKVGPDLARNIASALKLPQAVVFFHAGLITEDPRKNLGSTALQIVQDLQGRSESELRAARETLRALFEKVGDDARKRKDTR